MPARTSLPLSDLELDALTELVNIGVSRAATSLRDMIGKQVALSVPRIDLLSCAEAARTISEKEGNAPGMTHLHAPRPLRAELKPSLATAHSARECAVRPIRRTRAIRVRARAPRSNKSSRSSRR